MNFFMFLLQAANIGAEGSGINDGEYNLMKHEYTNLARGKYSGTEYSLFFFSTLRNQRKSPYRNDFLNHFFL